MNIIVPNNAVKYILFQRTDYLSLWKNKFFRKIFKLLNYQKIVSWESSIFKNKIKYYFNNDMINEYNIIKPYLPRNINSILDIGCGVAGIDALIFKHYNESKNIDFCLLDKTSIDRNLYYGFHNKGAFCNSLLVAKNLLIQNGINEKKIFLQEVESDFKILFSKKFDFVISLISWGFHYPVATYLEQVFELMELDDRLIIDIRKGTNGEFEVKHKFGNIKKISETRKSIRIYAIKK